MSGTPTLSKRQLRPEETIIIEVINTLRRNQNRTLEMKKKNTKALEASSEHLSRSQSSLNSEKFSQSLNYTSSHHGGQKIITRSISVDCKYEPVKTKITQPSLSHMMQNQKPPKEPPPPTAMPPDNHRKEIKSKGMYL